MEMCSKYGHDEIVYDSKYCPLCEAEVLREKITNELEEKIKELENKIQDLEAGPSSK